MMIFEERSPILDQTNYRKQIESKITNSNQEVVIISAFVKKIGVDWLESIIPSGLKVTIVARFLPQDILMQSSDLGVYDICKKNQWKFKCITELHAKIILIDKSHLFVGSQNLTGRGMGIVCNPNLEYGMMTIPTKEEVKIINSIVDQSLTMNDDIFEEYKKWLFEKKQNFTLPSFKDNPLKKYQVFDFKNIWCKDFPKINYEEFINNFSKSNQNVKDIKEIFSIDQLITKDNFLEDYDSFIMSSKIFNWIKKQANESDNQLFFGKLSSLIHDYVRDDPTPNRRLVKDLQANFYSFLKKMSKEIVKIDVPHARSERIVFNI